jgi:ribosomal protein S27E
MAYSKTKLKSYGNVVSLDFRLLGIENALTIFGYGGTTVNCELCTSDLVNDLRNSSNEDFTASNYWIRLNN